MAYVIQKGDTLSKIAKANNTTVQDLAKLNNISNPNLIRAGATLTLPGSVAPSVGAAAVQKETVPLSNQDVLKQYTDLLNAPYDPSGIANAYSGAFAQQAAAVSQAKALAQAQADAETKKMQEAYEQARKQIYVNSRLNALGNNEALASLGLAGNAYDGPQSGYSESSRVAQDVALRSDVAAATRQEQAQIDALAQQLLQAGMAADLEHAQWMAQMQIQQANAIETARQQDYQNKLNILAQIVGTNQQEFSNQQVLLKNQPTGGGSSGGRSTSTSAAVTNPYNQWDAYVSSLSDGQKLTLFTGTGVAAQGVLNAMRNDLGNATVRELQEAFGGAKYQWQKEQAKKVPTPAAAVPWTGANVVTRKNNLS